MYNSSLKVNIHRIMQNATAILQTLEPDTTLIPVLKDDAYGLGLVPVAQGLGQLPAIKVFAVAHISEGVRLRESGIAQEILVIGGAPSHLFPLAVRHGLHLAVGRLEMLPKLATLCREANTTMTVQLKIDTGLHRYGVSQGAELDMLLEELSQCQDVITLGGVFSHFSDSKHAVRCDQQYATLCQAIAQVKTHGFEVPLTHISSSATSEFAPQYNLNAVRIGRRLYMDHPTAPLGNIQEVASWQTYITALHPRKAGDTVGYGDGYHLERDSLIATMGVGYGDGLHQGLVACQGPVLVRGQKGRLLACCMDQCIIDVTGIDCAVDDVVTLFGEDGAGHNLSSQAVSLLVGTDEGCGLTSMLSPRVARIYQR